jgi:signal transduction histidine kinase/integral membrane sensor domain MASE1
MILATRRAFLNGAALTAAYVLAARIGFELAFVAEQVTTVWAPTGIAQAALLLWGVRLWPGVWAGAFLANAFNDAPLWTAGAIATGNTLEAVALVWLLGRTGFDPSLSRLNDAARFVLFGAVGVTAISATVGVVTLCAAAVQPWDRFADLWSAWWVGDALGALVIAPVILTAVRPVQTRKARRWINVIVTMAASATLAAVVFGGGAAPMAGSGPLHYVLFPFVIAAAVLVGQPATALAVFIASAIAIMNTVAGHGPFSAADAGYGLILLQIFMGVLASTAVLLCAAIAEQQRAEEAVRVSEERFRSLASSAVALTLFEQDRDLRYRWVFPQHPDFPDQNIGKTDAELLPPQEGQELMRLKRAVLESGAGSREEIVVTLQDTQHYYDITIEPRRDGSGHITGVGGVAIDISQRKRDEQLLRARQQQLREADRRKDEFLAMLAHELRNPLAPIRTGLEVWRLAGKDAAAAGQVRLMMERQVAHMVRLIDDLLDVSRITSGKIHLQKERADLHEMVDAGIDANREAIDAARLRLDVQLPERAVELLVDPTRFVQVISNLLHNAAKFTGGGGVITVSASVQRRPDGGRDLRLSVSDTGAGIPPDLLPHVFDLFTQGEGAMKADRTGLGVGLALARRIVELHDGTIEARSAGPGRGSEFVVRMPLVAGDDAPESHNEPSRAGAKKSFDCRVLVIDDNADSTELTAMLIRGMGGEVITATSGATGIQQALATKPDIILLDIGLPDMDGYEVCRTIRLAGDMRPWIVAVTGWGQQRDKDRAAAEGFDGHLTKPVDPALLAKVLRSRM